MDYIRERYREFINSLEGEDETQVENTLKNQALSFVRTGVFILGTMAATRRTLLLLQNKCAIY